MTDTAWLEANGFVKFGAWNGLGEKLHRSVEIKRIPGVYAFVADDKIVYIGKATHLRGRLRQYNRYRRVDEERPHRGAHAGLQAVLSVPGKAVHVFILPTDTSTAAGDRERELIHVVAPSWNGRRQRGRSWLCNPD
jgi:excinuclease UvrABC nuclease subunit